jgi:hypothetical protein
MSQMQFDMEHDGNVTIGNGAYRSTAWPQKEVYSALQHGSIQPDVFGEWPRNKPLQTQAQPDINYNQYNVVRPIQQVCDTVIWMAPGKPVDRGYTESNPIQGRRLYPKMSYAANAPYAGIYTGLSGYIDEND